jgi:hypothetical protein
LSFALTKLRFPHGGGRGNVAKLTRKYNIRNTYVTELFAVSTEGLRMSKPIPMIKIHQALTDGRNQERKEDLLDILWLQNRLIQVEFERDWIIAEKASMEEVIEEKA